MFPLRIAFIILLLTGRDVIEMVKNRPTPSSSVVEIKMTLINRKGKARFREFITWSVKKGNNAKSITKVIAPDPIKGKGVLLIKEGKKSMQYIYIPELKKMRRIAGGKKRESFLGSDLSYEDLSPRDIDEDEHRLLGEEGCGNHVCYVVESVPKDPESSIYGKIISWIRKDILIPVKGEFYTKKGTLMKVMEVKELKKVNNYWIVTKSEIEDVRKKHRTIVEIMKLKVDLHIPDSYFSERFFRR